MNYRDEDELEEFLLNNQNQKHKNRHLLIPSTPLIDQLENSSSDSESSSTSSSASTTPRGDMVGNQPTWLAPDAFNLLGVMHDLQKNAERLLPKFDPEKGILPEENINKSMQADY
jgi:hypothetical protein